MTGSNNDRGLVAPAVDGSALVGEPGRTEGMTVARATVGKCSVPMWMMGCPAGYCDKPAYGERPPGKQYWSYACNEMVREDGRYNGYVPDLACVNHGGPPAPEGS